MLSALLRGEKWREEGKEKGKGGEREGGVEQKTDQRRETAAWKDKEGEMGEEKVTTKLLCSTRDSSADSQSTGGTFLECCKPQENCLSPLRISDKSSELGGGVRFYRSRPELGQNSFLLFSGLLTNVGKAMELWR